MLQLAPAALFEHYLGISRLLAGQLDFRSAIRSVANEVAHIIPHDHLDVCVLVEDGNYHTAYETGIDTAWGDLEGAPVVYSPIPRCSGARSTPQRKPTVSPRPEAS